MREPEPPANAGHAKPARSAEPRPGGESERDDPHSEDADESRSGKPDAGATADRNAAEPPARTINRKVKLTLEEAAFGCTKVLRGKLAQACSDCAAVGYRVLGGHCPQCHGSGAIRLRDWFGWVGTQTECDACHGGGIARQLCAACAGTGKAATRRYQVTVRFPHGVRNGDLLSLNGRHGNGSLPGDLNIRVQVQPHALLELDTDGTVRCDVPIDGFTWMANRCVDVPTLDGLRTLSTATPSTRLSARGPGLSRGTTWCARRPGHHRLADISAPPEHGPADPARPAHCHHVRPRGKAVGRATSRVESGPGRVDAGRAGSRLTDPAMGWSSGRVAD